MTRNIEHTQRLIQAHRNRLEQLELDQATRGYGTPPEIESEIQEIRKQIAKHEAAIGALEIVEEIDRDSGLDRHLDRRDASYTHRLAIMQATVMSTVSELATVKKHVDDRLLALERLILRLGAIATLLFMLWSLIFVVLSRIGWL